MSRREYVQLKRRNNRSRVIRVYTVAIPRRYKVRHYSPVWYWAAIWRPRPGVRMQKSFSVKKYGERGAYRLALAARRQGLAEMGAGPHIIHPGQAPRSARGL